MATPPLPSLRAKLARLIYTNTWKMLLALTAGLLLFAAPGLAWRLAGAGLALGLSLSILWRNGRALRASTLQTRLLASYVLIAALPSVVISATSAGLGWQSGQRQVLNQLESVATLKQAEIEAWTDALRANLDTTLASADAPRRTLTVLQMPNPPTYLTYWLRGHFQQALEQTGQFEELFLLNRAGQVLVSTSVNREGKAYPEQLFFQEGLKASYVQPPAEVFSPGSLDFIVVRPVVDEGGEAVGVLAGRASQSALTKIMLERAGLGETGETYLVNPGYRLLTPLRSAEAKLYATAPDIANAINTRVNGTQMYRDYRGVPVIGVYHWLPNLQVTLIAQQDQAEAFGAIGTMLAINLGVFLASVLLATATSLIAARSIATPLAQLAQTAAQIAGGDLNQIVPMERNDEIGALAQAFNSMTAQLREAFSALEQRVADRTAQLQATNQELEAFSYSVSHDLRAPLRAIEGFSGILLSDYRDKLDEQGQHYLERIQQASQRMGQLINDLLNLSRITRRELASQSVDLGNLGREIAAELHTLDPQRQAEFVIAKPLTVQGDSRLLQIALQNLLGNAWKFSGTRPKAVIEVGQMTVADFKLQNEGWASHLSQLETSNPQSAIYYVRDNGVGFDMDHAAKLFAPFQRLHAMNEFPGTGIGLAIVQRVIARHGGRIWVHAQVDQGATFYFTLGDVS